MMKMKINTHQVLLKAPENEYLSDSKIESIFLPPYTLNPNLIEHY